MSRSSEFLILKPTIDWLPESWWKKVLGAVVLNPYDPTANRTPLYPPLEKNDLIEEQFTDFILAKGDVGSTSCELDVKHLGHFKWQKSAGQNLELKGKLIYVKKLTEHREFWKEMIAKDQAFADKVTEWVNEKRWGMAKYEVCWVVGLLLCQEVAVTTSQEQAREGEARGEARLGTVIQAAAAAHGTIVPSDGAGDMSARVGGQAADVSYFSVKGKEKYVFALELKVISSKKRKPEPTDKAPKVDRKQKLGDADEDEGLEADDLILEEELGKDDWDNLLREA